jgi:hypothetical protein
MGIISSIVSWLRPGVYLEQMAKNEATMNEFPIMMNDIRVYYNKWVDVASGGNVYPEFAYDVDRMRLHCTKCDATMTFSAPNDTLVPHDVQVFVKFHRHKSVADSFTANGVNPLLKYASMGDAVVPNAGAGAGFTTWTTGGSNRYQWKQLGMQGNGEITPVSVTPPAEDLVKKVPTLKQAKGRKFR